MPLFVIQLIAAEVLPLPAAPQKAKKCAVFGSGSEMRFEMGLSHVSSGGVHFRSL